PEEAPESIDAYLIHLGNMNPENCAQDPYLKAYYFADSSGTPYVAVPGGTTQGWIADNAANLNDLFNRFSNKHQDLALASMGPAPDITLCGFIANGCHGTGLQEPTVSDLVYAIEVVTVGDNGIAAPQAFAVNQEIADLLNKNHVTKATAQAAPRLMQALRVSLGSCGIITKLIFQLEPMFNVAHLDEYAEMADIFPLDGGDTTNLETLVTSCDYIEIFWFPYNTQLWIKRYSKTNAPTQHELKVLGFDWITSELSVLTGGLLGTLFEWFPEATPLILQVLFFGQKELMQRPLAAYDFSQDFNPSQDPIVKVRTAYLYQTKVPTNILDLSYAVPIPRTQESPAKYDFSQVLQAWNDVVNTINSMQHQGVYPVNLNVHARFIKNSDSFLSPANWSDDAIYTCDIEYLSFSEQLDEYAEFSAAIGPAWMSYGLPHWAKMFQLIPNSYAEAHQRLEESGNLKNFLPVRAKMDPSAIFDNDFLNEILIGEPTAVRRQVSARSAGGVPQRPSAFPTKEFQISGPQVLQRFEVLSTNRRRSTRGCNLFHDGAT
ncbi:MAG: D-arabinono-1,4-lactone oxidase, partial [Blastocatellia bacterium]